MGITASVLSGALMFGSVIATGDMSLKDEGSYKIIPVPQQEINWNNNANKLNYLSEQGELSYEQIIHAYLNKDFYVEECKAKHCEIFLGNHEDEVVWFNPDENKKLYSVDNKNNINRMYPFVPASEVKKEIINNDNVDNTTTTTNKNNKSLDSNKNKLNNTEPVKDNNSNSNAETSILDNEEYMNQNNNSSNEKADTSEELDNNNVKDDSKSNDKTNEKTVENSAENSAKNDSNRESDTSIGKDTESSLKTANIELSDNNELKEKLLKEGYSLKALYFPKEDTDPLGNSLESFYTVLKNTKIKDIVLLGYASPDGINPKHQINLATKRAEKVEEILKNKKFVIKETYSTLCPIKVDRSICWKVEIFYK